MSDSTAAGSPLMLRQMTPSIPRHLVQNPNPIRPDPAKSTRTLDTAKQLTSEGHALDTSEASPLYPRLPLPRWEVTRKSGEILDTDNALSWDVAEPVFKAGIKQVAILNRVDHTNVKPYFRPDTHMLALQIQGETGVSVNEQITWMQVGDLACIPARIPFFHTGKPQASFSYVYITVADDERWVGLKNRGFCIRPYESADYLYLLVRRLLDAQMTRSLTAIDHANRDSFTLVDLLLRETEASARRDVTMSIALRDLLSQINANPGAKWNNSEMAKALELSERSFLRLFKQEFNTSPKTIVMRQRMIKARERLAFTDEPIKKIAQDLGYANRRTFSAIFSLYVGTNPEDFRKRAMNSTSGA